MVAPPPPPHVVVPCNTVVSSIASIVPAPRAPTAVYGGVGTGATLKAKPCGQAGGSENGTHGGFQPHSFGGRKYTLEGPWLEPCQIVALTVPSEQANGPMECRPAKAENCHVLELSVAHPKPTMLAPGGQVTPLVGGMSPPPGPPMPDTTPDGLETKKTLSSVPPPSADTDEYGGGGAAVAPYAAPTGQFCGKVNGTHTGSELVMLPPPQPHKLLGAMYDAGGTAAGELPE